MKNKKGFTLIELLAVIVILGILIALTVPAVNIILNNSRKKTFKTDVANMLSAVTTDHLFTQTAKFSWTLTEANLLMEKPLSKSPFGNDYDGNSDNNHIAVMFNASGQSYVYVTDGEYYLEKDYDESIDESEVTKITSQEPTPPVLTSAVCFTVTEAGAVSANTESGVWNTNNCGGALNIPGTLTAKQSKATGDLCPTGWTTTTPSLCTKEVTVTSIANNGFTKSTLDLHNGNSSQAITSVTMPNTITSIGTGAFSVQNSLTSVTLSTGVNTIGIYAFYGCNLASVEIPASTTSVGLGAFGKAAEDDENNEEGYNSNLNLAGIVNHSSILPADLVDATMSSSYTTEFVNSNGNIGYINN